MQQLNFLNDLDEVGTENEDDFQVSLEDFHQAVIWGTDWTTDTIVSQMDKGNIDLNPKYQRREAWTRKRKSEFIESLILGLPIPPIILAEKKDRKGRYIVIDGKQRLLSIRQFFSKENDDEPSQFSKLKLSGLKSLKLLNGKYFLDIFESPSLEDYVVAVENQPIRTVVIKNWPNEEFLYNVFLRLNTGSLPLAPQELRQALHPGKFIDFADDFSVKSEQIRRVLGLRQPDYRMRDVELVIRYFAFKYFIESYSGNLKFFFDNTVKTLNKKWEAEYEKIEYDSYQLEQAIDFSYAIWNENVFRKWKKGKYEGRFNRAIFDIIIYYFSIPHLRETAVNKKDEIRSSFQDLCESDQEFLGAFESSTKNMIPTHKRYTTWGLKLTEILSMEIKIPEIKINK